MHTSPWPSFSTPSENTSVLQPGRSSNNRLAIRSHAKWLFCSLFFLSSLSQLNPTGICPCTLSLACFFCLAKDLHGERALGRRHLHGMQAMTALVIVKDNRRCMRTSSVFIRTNRVESRVFACARRHASVLSFLQWQREKTWETRDDRPHSTCLHPCLSHPSLYISHPHSLPTSTD